MPKTSTIADRGNRIGRALPRRKVLRIADLFCGAGGTSEGACRAARRCGYQPELTAINHWPVAVETHSANHPAARHLCTSIDNINPRDLYGQGELDMLWASPECTHHSVARGGRPIHDQSRATAWCVARWAEALRPPIILVENVPEFQTWGPLDSRGRPLKSRKGEVFEAWLNSLRALGYRVEARVLCAADYGDPTTRRRLFVQAVRGRRELRWPSPTHSPTEGDGRKRWRAAREIIDWDIKGRWIDEMPPRARYGGLPLSPNSLRRINKGFLKFGGGRFLVPNFGERDGQEPRCHSIDEPLPTVTSHGAGSLVEPFIVELRGTSERQLDSTARSVDRPLPTVSAGGVHAGLVEPFLVQMNHGNGGDPNGDSRRVRSVDHPLPTVCGTRGEFAIIEPALLPQQSDGRLRAVTEPCPTVATSGAIALVEPFLVQYYGTGGATSIHDPLDTVTTKDRHALVSPAVIVDGRECRVRYRYRMLQPRELAGAQGFPDDYQFTGTKTDQVKQIGNAVPCGLARALVEAVLRA
jgi:DNA (cytosine-5)-methyltransferase 1